MGPGMSGRIALFFPSLESGGVQRFMLTLSQGLMDRGEAVDLVLVEAKGAMLAQAPEGARVVDLHARRALQAIGPLAAYLRREKPAALLSAQTHVNAAAVAAAKFARSQTRIVVSERNHLSASVDNAQSPGDRLRPLLIRLFYPGAAGVAAVSEGVAADMVKRAGIAAERVRVIYNPVDLERVALLAGAPCPHAWLEAGEPPALVAVGRLSPQKDYPTLLRAFAQVRKQRPARLIIVGEGPQREALAALAAALGIERDTALAGYRDNPFAWTARAGAFVLSSRWEGFPNALVEALACGAPVVSTNCPSGPAEILENGRYGKLTPVGDADALAEAICATLDDPLPGAVMRARAADFSVERAVRAYREALLG